MSVLNRPEGDLLVYADRLYQPSQEQTRSVAKSLASLCMALSALFRFSIRGLFKPFHENRLEFRNVLVLWTVISS